MGFVDQIGGVLDQYASGANVSREEAHAERDGPAGARRVPGQAVGRRSRCGRQPLDGVVERRRRSIRRAAATERTFNAAMSFYNEHPTLVKA